MDFLMRKKQFVVILMMILSSTMMACGASIPEMTEEQHEQVVEYAAGLLLKYDKNYDNRLLTEEEAQIAAEEAQKKAQREAQAQAKRLENENNAQEAVQAEDGNQTGQGEKSAAGSEAASVKTSRIEEFYSIADLQINYAGYQLADFYPEEASEYMTLKADKGTKLLVFNFDVTNPGQQDVALDMISINPQLKISINGGTPEYTLMTILENDLSSYKGTIPAGTTQRLVLLGTVSEETAAGIQTVSLIMKSDAEDVEALLN